MFKSFDLRRMCQMAMAVAAVSMSSIAAAAPPGSAVGTWVILADQTYATLTITNQGAPGAPNSSMCRVIQGSLENAPIRGIYCPGTGHVKILHNNIDSKATVRTFTGSLSAATASSPAHIAGTMHVLNGAFGEFGEYPFSGTRQ